MHHLKKYTWILFFILAVFVGHSQTHFNGSIKDSETKEPIANAKIFISKQGIGTSTNTGGRFLYKKPHFVISDDSELTLWAKGYEPLSYEGRGYSEI